MYIVPCTPGGASSWSQRTALDGVDFTLTFRWSQRDGHWLMDIADAERSPIRSGMLLAPNVDLLAGVIDSRRPAGKLAVLDATGALDVDPGFADLGERFVLVYFTAAELAALASGAA